MISDFNNSHHRHDFNNFHLNNSRNFNNRKSEHIARWQTYLALLPDERFFGLMRAYLGKIKTPYNKQRLIERLCAFLQKTQHKKNIVALLDDFDKALLSAISLLPKATRTTLADFFSDEHDVSELYARLSNLEDRLLIFAERAEETTDNIKTNKTESGDSAFFINPILHDALSPYINARSILPEAHIASRKNDSVIPLSPEIIAAFVSYIMEHGDLCKADCVFKKIDKSRLETIFGKRGDCLQPLFFALLNLQLVRQNEKSVSVDFDKFTAFATLSEIEQFAFLCAAAGGFLSGENLRNQAQLLLNIARVIPKTGATRGTLKRTAMLLENGDARQTRFSLIMQRAQIVGSSPDNDVTQRDAPLFDKVLDAALAFGFFATIGKDANGKAIYKTSDVIDEKLAWQNISNGIGEKRDKIAEKRDKKIDKKTAGPEKSKSGFITLDAGFSVTVLPGLSLAELLPLVRFLNVKSCDTTVKFEINKNSVIRAFDMNCGAETICELLSRHLTYAIPQNLLVNIEDWQSAYNSALLYKGYIIKLDEKNAQILEKNPRAKKYVQIKLAAGIYVLNVKTENDVRDFVAASGFDVVGTVKSADDDAPRFSFPALEIGKNYLTDDFANDVPLDTAHESGALLKRMREMLDALNLPKAQKAALAERIDKKIIISEEQLSNPSAPNAPLEAGGMNFLGKVHLIESAINSHEMIEIVMPAENAQTQTLVGTPLQLTKQSGDSLVRIQCEPNKNIVALSVSRAETVRLLRSSVI